MRAPLRHPWPLLLLALAVLLCAALLLGAQPAAAHVLHPRDDAIHAPPDHSLGGSDDEALFLALEDRDTDGSRQITARVGGRGRARSDGISITRALRRDDHGNFHADSSGRALVFTPAELDLSRVRACEPASFSVRIESRSALPLRIDDVRFESDAFLLGSDPRGVVLDPGESVDVALLVVVGEPQVFGSFVFLVTSVGEFALPVRGHTQPSPYGLVGLRLTVGVGARVEHSIRLHNPSDAVVRVSEIFSLGSVGNVLLPHEYPQPVVRLPREIAYEAEVVSRAATVWEVPPLVTKSVARFTFKAEGPTGRHQSVVRVATKRAQFFVPIQIDVQQDQLLVVPSDIDVGVFTSDREQRHVLLTLHNTGPHPAAIHEVRAVEADGLSVVEDLQGDLPMIPPRSRVQHAVRLVLQTDATTYRTGRRSLRLEIKSNASSSDRTHGVRIQGFAMRGHISYALPQTAYRVVGPSINESDVSKDDAVELGTEVLRGLVLKNEFDVALELERVQASESCDEFDVEEFEPGIVAPFAEFPPIYVRVRPHSIRPITTRVCSLQVETNASLHQVPLALYTGHLRVTSLRNVSERALPTGSCGLDIQEDGDASNDLADDWPLPPSGSKFCRRIVMDLGRVAKLGTIEDVVNFTNINPTIIQPRLRLRREVPDNPQSLAQVDTTTFIHVDSNVAQELAALGAAWEPDRGAKSVSSDMQELSLAPGRTMSLRMRIKVKTKRRGVYLEPVATIETDSETIHLLVRFEAVRGAIKPETRTIEALHVYPGQLGFIDVGFNSTMRQDVPIRGFNLTITDGNERALGVWELPTTIRANSSTRATLFYFPPEFYSSCQEGRFYAECFVSERSSRPRHASRLSDFGSLVTQSDLERLVAREREWKPRSLTPGDDLGARVTILATLDTDAMRVHPIRINLYLVRPQFFHSGGSDQTIAFPLTELLQPFHALFTVTNPSDYAINMELAIAEDDRHLFYACDEDLNEGECLREWHEIARERAELARKARADGRREREADLPQVAPLFLQPRLVHVLARDQVQLGPIFFFPSSVGSWRTRVYIRNDLTHIEAVTITGSSGLGEVSIVPPTPPPARGTGKRTSRSDSSLPNEISFLVDGPDEKNGSSLIQSTQTVELRNSGSFQVVLSARLVNVTFNAFRMVSDRGSITSDTNGSHFLDSVVLAPNETLSLALEYSPDCIHSQFSSDLEISTRDGITNYRVVGAITPRATFHCRRQRFSRRALELTQWMWQFVVFTAIVAVVVAVSQLVRGVATRRLPPQTPVQGVPRSTRTTVSDDVEEQHAAEEMRALMRSLAEIAEAAAVAVESAAVVTTPHVAKLLGSRGKTREQVQPGEGVAVDQSHLTDDGGTISRDRRQTVAKSPQKAGPRGPRPHRLHAAPITVSGSPRVACENQRQEQENHGASNQDTETVLVSSNARSTRAKAKKDSGCPSQPEATTSEDEGEEEIQEQEVDNQADGEAEGTAVSTLEADDEEIVVQEGELLMLNLEEPFVGISDLRLDDPLQGGQALRLSLNFDDDWSAMSFTSLQSEIGKLVADDRAPSGRPSPLHPFGPPEPQDLPMGGALSSLSIVPPARPISSLFSTIGGVKASPVRAPSLPKPPKAAPPGFTPADANPEASREAFERVRKRKTLDASDGPSLRSFLGSAREDVATPPLEAAFATRYSLFGPTLAGGASFATATSTASSEASGTEAHIGSPRAARAMTVGVEVNSELATLGGAELPDMRQREP